MPTQPTLQQARELRAQQAALAASAGSRVAALVAAGATWTVILETFARFQLQAAVTAVQAFAQWTTAGTPRSVPTLHAGATAAGFELHEPLVAAADSVIPAPQAISLPDPWWDPRADYMTDILQKFERIVANEVRDAAREAAQVELAAEPLWDNYVRVLQAPSCKRCVVLAGRVYRDLDGFERHPGCDCSHVPVKDWDEAVAKGFAMSPQDAIDKGYARDLTKGERQAIDDGANISSVINSSSGISTVTAFGRRVKVTTVATTRRSAWRKSNPSLPVRLRPDAIYKIADGDHDEALRLLKLYGYLA